jgi:hypothetical protein
MATHVTLAITDTTLAITRKTNQIDAAAALDGIYVLRTSIPADQLDPPGMVTTYKNLAHVERDFSHHQSRRPGPPGRGRSASDAGLVSRLPGNVDAVERILRATDLR